MTFLLHGVPREATAFAAGVHATRSGATNWFVVAAAVSQIGLGTYPASAIREAVLAWSAERLDDMEAIGTPTYGETVRGIRGGQS